MMTKFAVACSALCLFACDAMDTGSLERALEEPELFTFQAVADPEAALIGVVPADNVREFVPEPYELLVLPGAGPGGVDGAVLFVFGGFHPSFEVEGEPAGSQILLHTTVQIVPPPPPPGETLNPAAFQLYDIRALFNNKALPKWARKGHGAPMFYEKNLSGTQGDPGPAGAGFVEVVVEDKEGDITFHVEYGPMAPGTPPAANTWYEGKDGLAFSNTEFADFQSAGAAGSLCADPGTWLGEILGAPCMLGNGLAFSSNLTAVFKLFEN